MKSAAVSYRGDADTHKKKEQTKIPTIVSCIKTEVNVLISYTEDDRGRDCSLLDESVRLSVSAVAF